jgi:O-acetylhomoserine (thiol)-lyase
MSDYGFNTLSIHAGAQPDPATGARATPIYQTTSFVFDSADHAASLFNLQTFGNIYTRINNPTNAVLEERVTALEGGRAGLAVASGHAAQFLCFYTLMSPGDEIVAARQLYGGSINQLTHGIKKFGWNVRWADARDPDSFKAAITDKTRLVFLEALANPGGIVVDIEPIAAMAHDAGVPLIVDNTFASPYLIQPISPEKRPYSIFGQRSITTLRPASRARAAASSLMTPSCIQMVLKPRRSFSASASRTMAGAASEPRKISTISTGAGTSFSEA